jgi:hypothetical protein
MFGQSQPHSNRTRKDCDSEDPSEVKAAGEAARGGFRKRRSAGTCRRGVRCVVVWESRFGPFGPRTVDSARVVTRRNGAAADQKTA